MNNFWNTLIEKLVPIIAKMVNMLLPKLIKDWVLKKLVGTIAGGGVAGWIVQFFLGKIIDKLLTEANSAAKIAVNDAIDEKNRDKYYEHIKQNAPEEVLVQDELDNFNRGRKP